jgi:uncharacterized repeat protein (TIGR03806 family)
MMNRGCKPGGDGSYIDAPFDKLSTYCLVAMESDRVKPLAGLPYDLQTPLFSDYATKFRTVFIPQGSATYTATSAFSFPTGTIFTKSFGFLDDQRDPKGHVEWAETRLLIRTATAWKGYTYKWNDDLTEASILYAGTIKNYTFTTTTGAPLTVRHLIPSVNQCKDCHANGGINNLIGPKARNLNKSYAYTDGEENQLARWTKTHLLDGAPTDMSSIPTLAAWDDATAPIEARARAYLEVNCAHCHNGYGTAGPSGLTLWASETSPRSWGQCKTANAAGPGNGGLKYDVLPGDPDHSILIFRLKSIELNVRMPPLSRSVVHREGLELVRAWIQGLPGGCN